ncbi:MAG: hypothetical protein PVF17_12200, partial [Ignavibacteria bacterium]
EKIPQPEAFIVCGCGFSYPLYKNPEPGDRSECPYCRRAYFYAKMGEPFETKRNDKIVLLTN